MAARKGAVAPTKMGRKPAPPGETPHERALRLGSIRLKQVLDGLRLLGNLANQGYELTEKDLAILKTNIVTTLNETMLKLGPKAKRAAAPRFRFPTDRVD